MHVSSDYEDLFKTLNAHRIRYLVVGGYAAMYYTQPRFTKDIDVWIIPELNDVESVYKALKDYGAPLKGMSPKDFTDKKMIFQIGVAPIRVDIMIDVPGVDFERAWKNRKRIRFGKTPINIMGLDELIRVKKRAGRDTDMIDVERLSRKRKRRK